MADLSFLLPLHDLGVLWIDGRAQEHILHCTLRDNDSGMLLLRVKPNQDLQDAPAIDTLVRVHAPTDSGLYVLPARVIGQNLGGTLIQVMLAGDVRRIQRRQFVRVPVELPTTTGYILGEDGEPTIRFALRIVNLSGGGMLFECFEPLKHDDLVQINLKLDGDSIVSAILCMVDTEESGIVRGLDGDSIKYLSRGFFSGILERDRQRVIQYVFKRQTSIRKSVPV